MSNDEQETVTEEWRPIPGLTSYEVSSVGQIRKANTKRLRKTPIGKRGYPVFSTRGHLFTVHRCVAKAFLPNPRQLPTVNHIDGNKENNCVKNLEWCSQRDNNLHARRTGLHKSDGDKPVIQLEGGVPVATFQSISEASRATGINRGNIGSAIYHRTYNGHHYTKAGGYEWKFKTK